jgi:N-acetylglucosamine-6-phosphate deacetylase
MDPMATILIQNARVVTPTGTWERGWILCRDRKIDRLGPGDAPIFDSVEIIDGRGMTLLPGFIDVHVHGGVGYDTMDATTEGLRNMAQFYARHGVTSFLATTWTDTKERIQSALAAIALAQGQQPNGATLLGAHLEGPYLNQARSGAQNTTYIRRASRDEALMFLDMNVIRLLALAPEFEENRWLIRECSRRGVTVSAAHTSATFEEMSEAVALGLSQATHTFNAMTGLHHREPGTLGAAMALPEIACELISDNIHVHPAAMKILWRVKGRDRVILITDSIRGAGMPDGEYRIDERLIFVRDGMAVLPDGTLAGSILTMDKALHNFMKATGEPVDNVWRASSLNAARAIHVSARKGSLEAGKDADVVLVDGQVNVFLTIAEGRIVYRKDI